MSTKEGPYTAYYHTKSNWWRVKGPSKVDAMWAREDHAQSHVKDMNAAHNAALSAQGREGEPVELTKAIEEKEFVYVDHYEGLHKTKLEAYKAGLMDGVDIAAHPPQQQGALTDEEIEHLAQGRILATSSGQIACIDGGQESDVHGFSDGLRYARDHFPKSDGPLIQKLVDALFAAEQYMTSTGKVIGHGCLCKCPVIDGHTGSCPIPPALSLAKDHGYQPTEQ